MNIFIVICTRSIADLFLKAGSIATQQGKHDDDGIEHMDVTLV